MCSLGCKSCSNSTHPRSKCAEAKPRCHSGRLTHDTATSCARHAHCTCCRAAAVSAAAMASATHAVAAPAQTAAQSAGTKPLRTPQHASRNTVQASLRSTACWRWSSTRDCHLQACSSPQNCLLRHPASMMLRRPTETNVALPGAVRQLSGADVGQRHGSRDVLQHLLPLRRRRQPKWHLQGNEPACHPVQVCKQCLRMLPLLHATSVPYSVRVTVQRQPWSLQSLGDCSVRVVHAPRRRKLLPSLPPVHGPCAWCSTACGKVTPPSTPINSMSISPRRRGAPGAAAPR